MFFRGRALIFYQLLNYKINFYSVVKRIWQVLNKTFVFNFKQNLFIFD
jgi:hypothetical protein